MIDCVIKRNNSEIGTRQIAWPSRVLSALPGDWSSVLSIQARWLTAFVILALEAPMFSSNLCGYPHSHSHAHTHTYT